MGNLKFKIHPLCIIFFAFLIISGNFWNVVSYLIVIILHELGHYFVAKWKGYKLKKLTIMPFGASIGENTKLLEKDEIVIAFAGPMVNFILILFCTLFWWIFPSLNHLFQNFCFANLITMIFNLLPIYPLDGGRIFYCLLKLKFNKKIAYKIAKSFSIIIAGLFFLFFIISSFYSINYTFGVVSIFLLSNLFFVDNDSYYEFFAIDNIKISKLNANTKTNIISVNENTSLFKIVKKLNRNKFNYIYVLNNRLKLIKIFTEIEIKNMLENFEIHTPINQFIKL